MSLHDKLAQKAFAMGKRSSDFSDAAKKHADATWITLIFSGVVWYFLGWLWALIPAAICVYTAFQSISATLISARLESLVSSPQASKVDFLHIVQTYAKTMETATPVPGTVADTKELPYSKLDIKNAIIKALLSTDDPQTKEHLKVGYVMLSDWQEGVGETNQGIDTTSLDMSLDAVSLAQSVLEQSNGSNKWLAMARNEQDVLKRELEELGLWK
jgi:hypothetical protein